MPGRLSVPLKAYLARSFGPEQIGQFISPGADLSASGLINNLNGQVIAHRPEGPIGLQGLSGIGTICPML